MYVNATTLRIKPKTRPSYPPKKYTNVFLLRTLLLQMMLKNLTDNAKNLAANAKIEDMSRLFKNQLAGSKDVKNAVSNIMVRKCSVLRDVYGYDLDLCYDIHVPLFFVFLTQLTYIFYRLCLLCRK